MTERISLFLSNTELFVGCNIEKAAGKLVLTTPPSEATEIIGVNAQRLVDAMPSRDEIVLTGTMAIWAYLVVFHVVLHQFRRVYYEDGMKNRILIAAHG